jgi:alpha-beta hydrolase superfamily lysophospholipase
MEHSESTFTGAGQLALYWQRWLPAEPPHAVIVIIHGIGEHSGRYRQIVNYFVPRGYAIFTFDLRGHGRSPGQRGYIKHWDDFRTDVTAFLAIVRQHCPSLPLILFGHSMGGVIALDYSLRFPQVLHGVIASSPAIGDVTVAPVLWFVAKILDRVWPTFSLSTQTGGVEWKVTRDLEVLRVDANDPYIHSKATPRLAMQIKHTVTWIQTHAREWTLPLLVVHGTGDNIASPNGSRQFVKQIIAPDVTYREYDGGYHELFNDIIREQVLTDTEAWLARHISPGPRS